MHFQVDNGIEQHRKLGGNPDIDVSYQYLRIFLNEITKTNQFMRITNRKNVNWAKIILIEKINEFLKKHIEKEKGKNQKKNFF